MKTPPGATSFCPSVKPLQAGEFSGRMIRHTFRPRGTQDWLLIFTQGGSGLYRFTTGKEFWSRPGDVTLYRPGVFQDYQFSPETGRWDLLWAHFLPRTEWPTWLNWPEMHPGFLHVNLHEMTLRHRLVRRMREMIQFHFSSQPQAMALGLNALEEVLIRCHAQRPPATRQPDPRIARALELLTRGYREPFSGPQLARTVGLSYSRFRHLFHEQVGESARNFQERQRLRHARERLALSRQTIAEIADEVGFNNPFYFTLRFKKHTGESPRAFRQRSMGTSIP
jgi:AraC family transcriptional regulator of arabinose operon